MCSFYYFHVLEFLVLSSSFHSQHFFSLLFPFISKSDTDLRKGPPPVRPKPVRPVLKAQEIESERKISDSDSFHVETRSKVKRWAPIKPFRPFKDLNDSESLPDSDAMETQTSYKFMRWKPKTPAEERERVSIKTSSKISQWPPAHSYQESDTESLAESEASSISFESSTKVKFWQPASPKTRRKYEEERRTYTSTESVSIDTRSKVNTWQQQMGSDVEETSITKKSQMKINLQRKPPKVSSGFRMDIPGPDIPEQVDLGRSRSKFTKITRKAEEKVTMKEPEDYSDVQVEVSEPEYEDQRRPHEGITVFSRKSEQKIKIQPPVATGVKLEIPEAEVDERRPGRRARSQETRTEFTRKSEQNIQLKSRAEKKPLGMKLEIPIPEIEERPRRRARSQETRTEYSRESDTQIIILEGSGDESESYYTKRNVIKKLPTPTPDKLVIEGDLFRKRTEKPKRVRVRKQGQPKSSTYKPVPYVSGPSTVIVPERKDVLMAAEVWDR